MAWYVSTWLTDGRVCLQACNRMSYVCVPLYDTLGENAVEFILNHSEASVVFVQGAKLGELAKVRRMAQSRPHSLPLTCVSSVISGQ
jgi:long-chain acyl-CoA synthetase